MVDGYGKLLRRLLRDHGWTILRRGKGDHEVWWNPETKTQVIVDNTRSRHTAQEILKEAGIKHRL